MVQSSRPAGLIGNQKSVGLGIYPIYTGYILPLNRDKPTELYHRYPFMPPTPTEIYHVQITQFELYHVYPKFTPTGQKIYQV